MHASVRSNFILPTKAEFIFDEFDGIKSQVSMTEAAETAKK